MDGRNSGPEHCFFPPPASRAYFRHPCGSPLRLSSLELVVVFEEGDLLSIKLCPAHPPNMLPKPSPSPLSKLAERVRAGN
jgi:hypothetical protein